MLLIEFFNRIKVIIEIENKPERNNNKLEIK